MLSEFFWGIKHKAGKKKQKSEQNFENGNTKWHQKDQWQQKNSFRRGKFNKKKTNKLLNFRLNYEVYLLLLKASPSSFLLFFSFPSSVSPPSSPQKRKCFLNRKNNLRGNSERRKGRKLCRHRERNNRMRDENSLINHNGDKLESKNRKPDFSSSNG